MPEIKAENSLYIFAEPFRQALSEVLSDVFGAPCSVSMSSESAAPSPDAEALCFGMTAVGGLRGAASIQLNQAEALALAQRLLSQGQDSAATFGESHKRAIEGLLPKFTERAAVAFTARFGQVTLQLNPSVSPILHGALVTLSSDSPNGPLSVRLSLAPEMLASVPAQTSAPAASSEAPEAPSHDNNLDLLLGVDLNLTLRFGQRTLTLREIMELSSGSIIELDRQVQEPADLLLGDRLIARGEVVIVDGNYGLRITEVSDPQAGIERMNLVAR